MLCDIKCNFHSLDTFKLLEMCFSMHSTEVLRLVLSFYIENYIVVRATKGKKNIKETKMCINSLSSSVVFDWEDE